MFNFNSSAMNSNDKAILEKCLNNAMEILSKYPCRSNMRDNGEIEDIPAIKSYVENARMYCRQLAVR